MTDCVYLRDERQGRQTEDGRQVYTCKIHNQCTKKGIATPFASCEYCPNKLTTEDPEFCKNFMDHLNITNSDNENTNALRNMLKGSNSFLVCGGPSAKELPLELIEQRGIWSMAVNNMAGYFRASSFVCADPPSKFHRGIWQDPQIMKFIPSPKMAKKRGRLRRKNDTFELVKCKSCNGNGKREEIPCLNCNGTGKYEEWFEPFELNGERISACDCPNVWGFERRSWMMLDDSFFLEDAAAWGNHQAGVDRTGEDKTVCTFLLALRLLYYLGSRRIYLVGVDFNMEPSADLYDNYAFGEERDANAIQSNNSQYAIVNKWLCQMQEKGVFEKFGLEVFNCYSHSGLRAFPYVPFADAVSDTLKDFPETPLDLVRWYNKN